MDYQLMRAFGVVETSTEDVFGEVDDIPKALRDLANVAELEPESVDGAAVFFKYRGQLAVVVSDGDIDDSICLYADTVKEGAAQA